MNVLPVPGLVPGRGDTDLNSHPEVKAIHHFAWEGRGRGVVPRACDVSLKNATERRGEGRGKSMVQG